LIKGEKWEVSAVYDTMFAARDVDLSGSDLFCSYFPTVDDLKLIISVGIKNLYFLGKIDDKESVSLLNSFDKSRKILEVIQLEY
jgi:deoxycytidylate deaminase